MQRWNVGITTPAVTVCPGGWSALPWSGIRGWRQALPTASRSCAGFEGTLPLPEGKWGFIDWLASSVLTQDHPKDPWAWQDPGHTSACFPGPSLLPLANLPSALRLVGLGDTKLPSSEGLYYPRRGPWKH